MNIAETNRRVSQVQAVLRRVTYKDWHFRVTTASDYGPVTLQLYWRAADTDHPDGEHLVMQSRRWVIEDDASDQEIVQTALAAVLTAEEHEARELFRVDGRHLYGPHENIVPEPPAYYARYQAALEAASSWPRSRRRISTEARAFVAGIHDPDDAYDMAVDFDEEQRMDRTLPDPS